MIALVFLYGGAITNPVRSDIEPEPTSITHVSKADNDPSLTYFTNALSVLRVKGLAAAFVYHFITFNPFLLLIIPRNPTCLSEAECGVHESGLVFVFFPRTFGGFPKNMHNFRTKKGPHAYPRVEAWPGFEGQFVRWDYPRCFLAIHRVPSVHGSPSLKFCYRRLNRSALRPRGICPNGLYSGDRPQPFTNPTCDHFPRGTLPGCLISQIRFDAWIGTPLGILISSRATPCFRSMRTSIVDTLLPHTRSIGMQSVPSPRSEPLHYKVKTEKLSLSLT